MLKRIELRKAGISMCLAAMAVAGALALLFTAGEGAKAQSEQHQGYEIILAVSAGESRDAVLQYSSKRVEELQWGPKALAVAPDGSFVIANTVSRELVRLNADGKILSTIDVSKIASGITDLEATGAGIFALDGAAFVPAVLHLAYDGKLVAKYDVPAELRDYLTGLAMGEGGELLLEHKAEIAYRLLDASGAHDATAVQGLTAGGVPVRVQSSTETSPSRAGITVGSTQIDVSVANTLAGVRLLGVNADRSFYVIVNDLVVDDAYVFRIDQVVRHYSADGKLLGMARFPMAEQTTEVDHTYALGRDGSVYVLLTRPDKALVARLIFFDTLERILPAQQVKGDETTAGQAGDAPQCSIYRSTMVTNAWSYKDNSKYLTATNTDGACTGRGKPRYIGGAGTYESVAYDWGGWDTVSGYNSYMNSGSKAGDIDTLNPSPYGDEACSRGVDCSGYVTRVWGRTNKKYGTATLHEISTALAGYWVTKVGDIMNKPNDHVRIINWRDANGAAGWESTTDWSLDRVVSRYLYWDRYSGYTARRYNDVCDP